MMPSGRRRTAVDRSMGHNGGRCHHHLLGNDNCCGSLQSLVHHTEDIGGKSYAVVSAMMSVVMIPCHGGECEYGCDSHDECDLQSFHFSYPFFLVLCGVCSTCSDHITEVLTVLLYKLLRNLIIFEILTKSRQSSIIFRNKVLRCGKKHICVLSYGEAILKLLKIVKAPSL